MIDEFIIKIDPEYFIALCLINLGNDKDAISFRDVAKIIKELQWVLNELDDIEGTGFIIVNHGFAEAVLKYPKYFEMFELNDDPYIKRAEGITTSALVSEFKSIVPFIVTNMFDVVWKKYQEGQL